MFLSFPSASLIFAFFARLSIDPSHEAPHNDVGGRCRSLDGLQNLLFRAALR
jgi:hypothetical protein